MKTKFIIYIILIAGFTACTKDLDQAPISQASEANFFRNTADFEVAVNGMYQSLLAGEYGVNQFEMAEIRSDNVYSPGTSGVRDWLPLNNFESTLSTNPYINALWQNDFNGILRTNSILDRLDASLVPDNTTRARMEGEAKFFRAFYYFDLVRFVGKVPLFDHVATPTEALEIGRSPVSEVYELIISDLQTAISNLPATYPSTMLGKVTTNAAKGILALVYLTRSGPDYGIEGPGLGTNDYAAAIPLLNEIISSGIYSLQPTYAKVFEYGNEHNSEIIFDIEAVDDGTTNNSGLGTILPTDMYPGAFAVASKKITFQGGVDGDGYKEPSADLLNSFEPNDVRDDFSIQMGFTDVNGNMVNSPFFIKFLDTLHAPLERFNWPVNYPILRYADVLLMKAEAILRGGSGGTQAEVDALVKQVRDRAGLSGTVLTNVTLDQLLTERRHEFMAEGKRWHDLVRCGKVLTTMAAFDASDDVSNKMNPVKADYIIYPFPQSQLSINPGLYTQNPGY